MSNETENDERSTLAVDIVAMELELERLCKREARIKKKIGWGASVANRTFLYLLFGPRLTKSLGALLHSSKHGNEPLLGAKLANVLDSASRRITGYKRWALVIGLLAAIPGTVSAVLLWQQNVVVKRETENTIADIDGRKRLDLLLTIFSSEESDIEGARRTPTYSARLRAEAVLDLIKIDTDVYREAVNKRGGTFKWRVDLASAPLGKVNFAPSDSEGLRKIEHVRFNNSNFFQSSFRRCNLRDTAFIQAECLITDFRDAILEDVNFSGAIFYDADFRGAVFKNCEFKGAQYNVGTQWPEGFDPSTAGAIPLDQGGGGL